MECNGIRFCRPDPFLPHRAYHRPESGSSINRTLQYTCLTERHSTLTSRLHPSTPNILVITVHDLGWADLGCYGNSFHQTPNLDRLALEGVRFTQAYSAAPICNPSRAAILTGLYPARYNLTGQPSYKRDRPNRKLLHPAFETDLPKDTHTFGHDLRTAGYRCAFSGVIGPGLRGESLSHYGFEELPASGNREIAEVSKQFLLNHSTRIDPFYLQVNYQWVHTPLHSQKERIERFAARIDPTSPWKNPVYAAVLEELDESVGAILATVDALQLRKSTVVMFLSDHGGYLGFSEADRAEFGQTEAVTSNHPLREGKASLYEGGIRIPWIVRWPSQIKPGQRCHELVNQVDLYPTVLEISGLEPGPEDLDGIGLLALFKNSAHSLPSRTFFWHWPHYRRSRAGPEASPSSAVRSGDWKLIEFFEDGRTELYNLAADIGESQDRAQTDAKRRADLHAILKSWRISVDAQLPRHNPN